ncbi:EmrB/QacA subfamily drug resistance transporter [Leifsonia sp. AK011]|uniref:MFS transporter n=1 Tax=Leifsonia sp. AK011 TaxID=2723075 RepID=UPI0017EFA5CA|nr:MFS transporter [Leifsonia sp. AK011]NYF11153.1 EmrB/QacA subfamily drug resistance transporter [Leifsonia sp. AK011]
MSSTDTAASPIVEAGDAARQFARRWWILATIGLAQTMVALDGTVMNIALPSAQAELGFDDGSRPWIITAYSLAFASLLLLSGRLADRFGRKNIFIIGLAGFAVASAVGGAAINFEMLVTARAVQGAFAALLAPAALALLTTTFTNGRERARAFGVFGAIGVGGLTIGLVLGGALTEYLSWRSTMYINLLFAIPAIIGAIILLGHAVRSTERAPIDIPGTLTVSAGLFSLVYGFSRVESDGWDAPITIAFLAAGVILLAVFFVLQARLARPLLPLRVILDRERGGGLLGMLLSTAGMLGMVFLLAYYVQGILGYSAVQTGIAFLPMPIALATSAIIIAPRVSRLLGPKISVPLGFLIGATAMLLLTRITTEDAYVAHILPSLILLGLGLGLAIPTSTSIATMGLRREDTGVGSSLVSTVQQVGGALGVAILSSVAATAAVDYVAEHAATATLPLEAAVHADTIAFFVSAGLFLLGAVVTATLLRPGRVTDDSDEPAGIMAA